MSTAILFTHGIQGSPAQFRFLTERLPEPLPNPWASLVFRGGKGTDRGYPERHAEYHLTGEHT